ncbi:MAG TPA: DUF1684 domain-containing protein [Candidatus Limnocylindrales bacterium]
MSQPEANDRAAHAAAIQARRAAREARLRDPMGWLSLVGLHWLAPGPQRFGSSDTNDIVLHAEDGVVPPLAGTLEVADGRVLVRPAAAALTVDGRPIADRTELVDDEADAPTMLELASLRLVLIRRGAGRQALRVRDVASPALRAFEGLPFFDIDPRWRLTARLVRANPGATIRIPDVVGSVGDEVTPGDVEFDLDGRTHRLLALEGDSGRLWLVFGDQTNGRETYGGGRFLMTGPVQPDDTVEVDFNLAYNPPCAFSPYATCPLPPSDNRLGVRVEAGERSWASRAE